MKDDERVMYILTQSLNLLDDCTNGVTVDDSVWNKRGHITNNLEQNLHDVNDLNSQQTSDSASKDTCSFENNNFPDDTVLDRAIGDEPENDDRQSKRLLSKMDSIYIPNMGEMIADDEDCADSESIIAFKLETMKFNVRNPILSKNNSFRQDVVKPRIVTPRRRAGDIQHKTALVSPGRSPGISPRCITFDGSMLDVNDGLSSACSSSSCSSGRSTPRIEHVTKVEINERYSFT